MSVLWPFLYILIQNCNAQTINGTTHLTTISELATSSAWSFMSTLDTIHYVLLGFAFCICCCICIILSEDYGSHDEYDEFEGNDTKHVKRTSYQACGTGKKRKKRRMIMKAYANYAAATSHRPFASSHKSISSFPALLSLP
eukprot:881181_1